MNKNKCAKIFTRLQQNNPHPTTELNYQSIFELLIAVILSAQATDIGVNKATAKLFPKANTAKAIYNLGIEGLKPYIKTIGLFNNKAKNIISMCKILLDKYDGIVPCQRDLLEQLPGVGRKTANVILNTAFNQPVIAVDTHIFRVSNRTKIAIGKNVLEVENKLMQIIPERFLKAAHHWLILHGRYTCTARKPQCRKCIIKDLCEYPDK